MPAPAPTPRSRGPIFVLLAVVALLVVGVGGLIAIRSADGGDDGVSLVEVEGSSAFSLAAAAENAAGASTVRYEVKMSVGGLGDIEMAGGIDTEAQIMTMTMSMGEFLGGGDIGEFDAIIDARGGVIYMHTSEEMGFPGGAGWVSMDLSTIAEQSGMSIEDFQDQFSANPLDVAELFTVADDVVDLGADTIDGVAVRHYRVAVDIDAALAANPQLGQQVDLSDIGGSFPDTIGYDVWVTGDNQLRRMTFALDVLGEEMSVEMDVIGVGVPLDVEIPSPADVTDLTGFLGGS